MQPVRSPWPTPPPSPPPEETAVNPVVQRTSQTAQASLKSASPPPTEAENLRDLYEQQLQMQEYNRCRDIEAQTDMLEGIALFDPANPQSVTAILSKFQIFHRGKLSLLILEVLLNHKWTDPNDPRLCALHKLNEKDPAAISIFAKALWNNRNFSFELYGEILPRVTPLLEREPLDGAVIDFIICGLRWNDTYAPDQETFVDQFFRVFFTKNRGSAEQIAALCGDSQACLKLIASASRLKARNESPHSVIYMQLVMNAFCQTSGQERPFETLIWVMRPLLKRNPHYVMQFLCGVDFDRPELYPLMEEAFAASSVTALFKQLSAPKCGSRATQLLLDSAFKNWKSFSKEQVQTVILQGIIRKIEQAGEQQFNQMRLNILIEWIRNLPFLEQETILPQTIFFSDFSEFWQVYHGRAEILKPDSSLFDLFRSLSVERPELRLPANAIAPSQEVFKRASLFEKTLLSCQFPRSFSMPAFDIDNLLADMEDAPAAFSCNLWILHQNRLNKEVACRIRNRLSEFLPLLVDGAEGLELPPQAELMRLNLGLRILAATLTFEQNYDLHVIESFQKLMCNCLALFTEATWNKDSIHQFLVSLGEIARKAPGLFVTPTDANTREVLNLSDPITLILEYELENTQYLEIVAAVYQIHNANPALIFDEMPFPGETPEALKPLIDNLHPQNRPFFKKAFQPKD